MPSTFHLLAVLVPLAAGCLTDDAPQPNVAHVGVTMHWVDHDQREIDVSVPQDIPCSGSKHGFLGDEGIDCVSAPWTLTVEGVAIETTPVKCTSAHDGFFGPVDRYCEGGRATAMLMDGDATDVAVVAKSEVDERTVTLRDVRRTFGWTELAPFANPLKPGIVRVDEVAIEGSQLTAWLTPPGGGTEIRGTADVSGTNPGQLHVSPLSTVPNGVYTVRVLGYVRIDNLHIAVPLTGTLTVAHE